MTENLPAVAKPQLHSGAQVAALVPQTLDEMYRLADAMSRSNMMPRGIQTPEAVMVAIMAGSELGFAPFQSVQSIAIINNRPSVWGSAIPALLWSHGFDIEETFEGEDPSYPDTMKAVCTITRPGGKKITRSFSVADAKEGRLWTKDGPWQTARKRMIQMRARGYAANDGASDVLRGLHLAEEVQDYVPLPNEGGPQPSGTGMVERLTARAVDVDAAGFNVRGITAETEAAAPKRRGRPPKEKEVAPETIAAEEAITAGYAEVGERYLMQLDRFDENGFTPSYVDGVAADNVDEAGMGGMKTYAQHPPRPTETASALSAEAEQGSLASATGALTDILEEELSPLTIGQPCVEDVIAEGYPEADEVYHLNGDEWAEDDGRRDTYKNGEPFSGATRKAGLAIYEDHAPEAIKAPELAPSDFPPEFNDYIDAVEKATTWNDGLTAMQVFYKTDAFKGMTAAQQNKIRAQTWQTFSDDGTRMTNLPDPAQNASAFRLFTEATEDADAIEGCLRVLENETGFISKPEDFKNAIRKAAAERMAMLRQ